MFGITFEPKVGKQPEPLEGWYAWAWSPSPGASMVADPSQHPKPKVWQHDLFHGNFTPYDAKQLDVIKTYANKSTSKK